MTQPSLRERNRRRLAGEVRSHALALFLADGFDGTTVEQLASAAGISVRTFFRHFPTKEDVVADDPREYARQLVEELQARPLDEEPWVSIGFALLPRVARWQSDPAGAHAVARLIEQTPSLAARIQQRSRGAQQELAAAVATRLASAGEGADATGAARVLRSNALVSAAFACLDVAFRSWPSAPGRPLAELLDDAMSAVTDGRPLGLVIATAGQ